MAKKANLQRFDLNYFKANRNEIISYILSYCKDSELKNVMNEMVSRANENIAVDKNIYRFINNCVDYLEEETGRKISDPVKVMRRNEEIRLSSLRNQFKAL